MRKMKTIRQIIITSIKSFMMYRSYGNVLCMNTWERLLFIICIFSSCTVYAIEIEKTSQNFSLKLGATRLIYNMDSNGEVLVVSNPQDYPMLVQSKVYGDDRKSGAPFMVTPPLFRLNGQQDSQLRIVRTGGSFAKDRESLQWLCVKGIPPKQDDAWAVDDGKSSLSNKATLHAMVSVSNCIKLLIRPSGIGKSADAVASIKWELKGRNLLGKNSSPFYINLSTVKVGEVDISIMNYIPPFSSQKFELSETISGKVQWKAITDYGGETIMYSQSLN